MPDDPKLAQDCVLLIQGVGMADHEIPINIPSPEEIQNTQLTDFIRYCEITVARHFQSYENFENFAFEHYQEFWRCFLDWSGVVYAGDPSQVCSSNDCERAEFFPHLRLNIVENLLRIRDHEEAARPALTSCSPEREPVHFTRAELRRRVTALASALRALGVTADTCVAMVAQNDEAAVVAALGAAALGAVVSMGSTELAPETNISRLMQVQPALLFCHLRSPFPAVEKQLCERVKEIVKTLPSLRLLISLDDAVAPDGLKIPFYVMDQLIASESEPNTDWPLLPFNHPYSILFTSGTTGRPRSIVHGAGGVLLEHLKSYRLHFDVRPTDKVFFQSSTAWVIWRHPLSMLAAGAEIVLNSAPVSSPEVLWQIVAKQGVTVFGTTPAYLKLCELHNYSPKDHFAFDHLRSVLAMGSILDETHQTWVRSAVKPLVVKSNYGSTDFAGSVLAPNPNLPDYPGQLQSRGLGLDIRVVRVGECGFPAPIGELVIANPFPSRPIGFLNDPDGARFHESYFARNLGFWNQGDLAEFTPQGGARLHGRSDSVINIRGIRVGPGEIYRSLLDTPEIASALAVAQSRPDVPGGERLILFVTLTGGAKLTDALIRKIKDNVRKRTSPTHVPDVVAAVPDLPMTHNGKLSERSAADAVNTRPIANLEALKNPECLKDIADHPGLQLAADRPHDIVVDQSKPTEAVVQEIWERAFGRPIGRGENFFDCGGDSLTAIQILLDLDKTLGRNLPITILYQTPTIESLAHAIDRELVPDSSLVILLRDGVGTPPLFMVHDGGGNVMNLRPLAQVIRHTGPIFGIRAKGLMKGEEPLRKVEDMAQCYVEAVHAAQPKGPYLIGGYSLGGLVALEMARLLASGGEEIRPILLFDTHLHEKYWPILYWLQMLAGRLRIQLKRMSQIPLREVWPFVSVEITMLVRHLIQRHRGGFAAPNNLYGLPPLVKRMREIGNTVAGNYQPRFLDQEVHLFKAEQGFYQGLDPIKIWSRYVRVISVEVVPGDHGTILLAAHREAMADAISRYLENAHVKKSTDHEAQTDEVI
jgi:acetoacetyl-CoA synthetase